MRFTSPTTLLIVSLGLFSADLSTHLVTPIRVENIGGGVFTLNRQCAALPTEPGQYFLIDPNYCRVLRYFTTGRSSLVAGNSFSFDPFNNPYTGWGQYSGDGGPAVQASLSDPTDLAYDREGNLLVCDTHNNVIRRIRLNSPSKRKVWRKWSVNGRAR